MESNLVRIIRGLPQRFEDSVLLILVETLEAIRRGSDVGWERFLDQLEAAAKLMIPLPDFDVSDFIAEDIMAELEQLLEGDAELWGQLLHALDDRHSGLFARLKALTPFASDYLMFLDVSGSTATLRAELDDTLADEFLRRADAHNFPGNCYVVVVPPEALSLMRFVGAVDDLPTTA